MRAWGNSPMLSATASRAGVIQNFEVIYELSWKLMARWLNTYVGTGVADGDLCECIMEVGLFEGFRNVESKQGPFVRVRVREREPVRSDLLSQRHRCNACPIYQRADDGQRVLGSDDGVGVGLATGQPLSMDHSAFGLHVNVPGGLILDCSCPLRCRIERHDEGQKHRAVLVELGGLQEVIPQHLQLGPLIHDGMLALRAAPLAG